MRHDQPDRIVDLTQVSVLTSPQDLKQAIRRLAALVNGHPNPSLARRLLSPVVLPLWALASWPTGDADLRASISSPAKALLETYLKISASADQVRVIVDNLLTIGSSTHDKPAWAFELRSGECAEIRASRLGVHGPQTASLGIESLDSKATFLADMLHSSLSDDNFSAIFLSLIIKSTSASSKAAHEAILLATPSSPDQGPMATLSRMAVAGAMLDKFPDRILQRSDHVLTLVGQIFSQYGSDEAQENAVGIALSLLNIVVTSPAFRKASVDKELMQRIEHGLVDIQNHQLGNTASTAKNLSQLLEHHEQLQDAFDEKPRPPNQHSEDRKTYKLALTYLTDKDSPPPVRAEGVNLIMELVKRQSPMLDIPAILVLMSTILGDAEDFVNLRVIQVYVQLAARHPRGVTDELLERYIDAKELATIDVRLRFGEALLQVVQRLGEAFSGDTARRVVEALLAVAGRRGHRPRTLRKQEREQRRKEREAGRQKEKHPPDVDFGLDFDMAEDEDEMVDGAERAREQILARIVEGWDSKRGSEDVRIRASALSILGTAIETNIAGIASQLISTSVDLCINILTLERDMETAILRRAAILVVQGFVRALDAAREERRPSLGFGLTEESRTEIRTILAYISQTDTDGLVQQHAKDVLETLDTWQSNTLLAATRPIETSLTKLAGLSVDPESSMPSNKRRPKIEEL